MYNRVNWENSPSTNTPIDAENLNIMDEGIAELDDEVTELKTSLNTLSFAQDDEGNWGYKVGASTEIIPFSSILNNNIVLVTQKAEATYTVVESGIYMIFNINNAPLVNGSSIAGGVIIDTVSSYNYHIDIVSLKKDDVLTHPSTTNGTYKVYKVN